MKYFDQCKRPLQSLRVSVTDRCNLRCSYCMPEKDYLWMQKETLLNFKEITRLVDIFSTLGVSRIRLTGGEPLLRKQLPNLVKNIASFSLIKDIALTTNGVFFI